MNVKLCVIKLKIAWLFMFFYYSAQELDGRLKTKRGKI